MKKPPDRILFGIIAGSDRSYLQRKLLSVRDKDIAASLAFFSAFEREIVFSLLGKNKGERVREELKRGAGIRYDDYRKIIQSLIRYLREESRIEEMPDSWFRPGRNGEK